MKRLYILVEGQTEESFANEVLYPHFFALGAYINPIIVYSKIRKRGKSYRGGVNSYVTVRKQIEILLFNDRSIHTLTTMFDLFHLPTDFPGMISESMFVDPYVRVQHLESSMLSDINSPKYIPYLQLHEFESILLFKGDHFRKYYPPSVASCVDQHITTHPELLNGTNPPSYRILDCIPGYDKVDSGSRFSKELGLTEIRAHCPHFDSWITTLEARVTE